MKYQLIVLFGPPGSGKGTQAQILKENFKYTRLGTSDILYDFIKKNKNNILEKIRISRIENALNTGNLVSFGDIIHIMEIFLIKEVKKNKKITLDGFPRNKEQAIWLSKIISQNQIKTLLIHLDLSLENSLKRINNRWFLESNDQVFSSYEQALKEGKKPFRRKIDLDTKTIENRYTEQYLQQKNNITEIIRSNDFIDLLEIRAEDTISNIAEIIKERL